MAAILLASVPQSILQLAQDSGFIGCMAGGDADLMDRLISHSDMDDVWTEMVRYEEANPETYPGDDGEMLVYDHFVSERFLYMVSNLRVKWARMSKTPTKQLEADCNQLARDLTKIAKTLRHRATELQYILGLPLDAYLWSPGSSDHRSEMRPRMLDGETLPDTLDHLAQILEKSPSWDYHHQRPTKPNDKNAERTFCIHVVANFFSTHMGEPKAGLVARTVSTVLDLSDPITDDHVSKLITT